MPHDLFDLTGRNAVVTGGSRGLGRAMVIAFAERGADVVIASRKDTCDELAEEVRAKTGRRAMASDASSYTTGAINKIDGGAVWSS